MYDLHTDIHFGIFCFPVGGLFFTNRGGIDASYVSLHVWIYVHYVCA